MILKLKNIVKLIILLIILFVFAGCHRYYKATTKSVKYHPDNTIDSLKSQNRYFILRTPNYAYYMGNIVLSNDRTSLACTLDSLPPLHKTHLNEGKGKMRYSEPYVLTEVHIYMPEDNNAKPGNYTLSLDQIQKIEILQKDKKRTTNSYVIGALGYTLGAVVVAGIIIAATKSSCPFVSAYDGSEFPLQGEIYGGAIYPQLARDDYMPLRMKPTAQGTLQVKISNELQEKQYTDFADLLVITHDKNAKVLSDEKGNLYQINTCESAVKAYTGNYSDALPQILKAGDNRLLHFDDTSDANNNYLVIQFNKPLGVKNGKLVLSVKNSYWLDYLYGEFAKEFGSYFTTYAKKQRKVPATQLLKWTKDQKLPLGIEIKTKKGWTKITDITTIGPLATRDIVIPVDLSDIKTSLIEIRLSSGFMFWEFDYAGIDYSSNKNFSVQKISPSVATDETGKDVLPALIKKDRVYLEQPVPGNMVNLEYKCDAEISNTTRSYILYTNGYYEHVRHFTGSPNVAFLKQFKQPDAFPQFSLQRFKQFNKEQMELLSKN